MKLLTAKDAKKIVKEFKEKELNFQRKFILKSIQEAANAGESHYIHSPLNTSVLLNEDDLIFFKKLGYRIFYTDNGFGRRTIQFRWDYLSSPYTTASLE